MNYFIDALHLLFGGDSELRKIILVTMEMSFFSASISCLLGIPAGMLIGSRDFRGKRYIMRFFQTLMGLPPVVAGLLVFMLLSREGPLGFLRLLFTVKAMIIAQVTLITPVTICLTANIAELKSGLMRETARGLNLSRRKELFLLFYESRRSLVTVALTAFGRSIAEVGAVQMVGGNVQFKTRVMTTAIVLETNKGNFELAVSLGIILLLIAFVVNSFAQRLQEEKA